MLTIIILNDWQAKQIDYYVWSAYLWQNTFILGRQNKWALTLVYGVKYTKLDTVGKCYEIHNYGYYSSQSRLYSSETVELRVKQSMQWWY